MRTCPECCGEGAFEIPRPFHDDPYYCEVAKCSDCNGSGYIDGDEPSMTLDEALELDAEKLEALIPPKTCRACGKLFANGDTCSMGGCPMGGDF